MKGYIHIGIQKTGSTTLQSFLYANHELLRDKGYLYPLSVISASPYNHEHRLHTRALPRLVGRLRRELRRSGGMKVILSQENLATSMLEPEKLRGLRDFLQQVGLRDITIIIYLREVSDLYASWCGEMLRWGRDLSFIHTMPQDALSAGVNMDYRSILQGWGAVFGAQRLKVRLFAPGDLYGGDLLRDFIQAIDGSWDQHFVIPPRQNESLDLLEMTLMSGINRALGSDADTHRGRALKRRIFACLRACRTAAGGEAEHAALAFAPPRAISRAYAEYFAASNEWVREHYFPGRAALFAPPRCEQASYRENFQLQQLQPACWDELGGVLLALAGRRGQNRGAWRRAQASLAKRLAIWRALHLPQAAARAGE